MISAKGNGSLAVFYLGGQAKPVLFPRSQNAQIVLNPLGVVVDNIILNHLNKRFPGSKVAAIVTLALENTPKAFHWTVVNAVGHARHTLYHFVLLQHLVEFAVGVLETTVTVEQWVRVRIGPYCFLESVKYQRIVVAVTNHIGDDTTVI